MADLIWDESGTVATLDPAGRLPTETTYTIAFTGTLRDQFGDTVPLPAAHSFTTPPAILNAAPTGSSIQPTAAIRVTFDRLMDEAKTAAALSITPAISGTIRWNETTLIFQPDAGMFDEYTEYTVAITSEAVGLEGESVLNGSYSWSFRTTNVQKVAHFGYGPNAQVVDVNGRRAIQYVLTNRANLDSVTFFCVGWCYGLCSCFFDFNFDHRISSQISMLRHHYNSFFSQAGILLLYPNQLLLKKRRSKSLKVQILCP